MECLVGKKSKILHRGLLDEWTAPYSGVCLDLGCGDGKLIYRMSGLKPDVFFIGVDAARENLAAIASKSRRSPKKGGRTNLAYLISPAESLPGEMGGIGDKLMVNFPWGSLLRMVLQCHGGFHEKLFKCLKSRGEVSILLNDSLYSDEDLIHRLDLPRLDHEYLQKNMVPAFLDAGFCDVSIQRINNTSLPFRTSWGRRLRDSHPDGASWFLQMNKTD